MTFNLVLVSAVLSVSSLPGSLVFQWFNNFTLTFSFGLLIAFMILFSSLHFVAYSLVFKKTVFACLCGAHVFVVRMHLLVYVALLCVWDVCLCGVNVCGTHVCV